MLQPANFRESTIKTLRQIPPSVEDEISLLREQAMAEFCLSRTSSREQVSQAFYQYLQEESTPPYSKNFTGQMIDMIFKLVQGNFDERDLDLAQKAVEIENRRPEVKASKLNAGLINGVFESGQS